MAELRSVQAIGDVLVVQLRDVTCAVAVVSLVLLVPVEAAVIEPNETVDGGSQEDVVDKEEEVEAESLLQEDSRLDSVSVEPVLPIDIVLPICMPFAFIGFVSARMEKHGSRLVYDTRLKSCTLDHSTHLQTICREEVAAVLVDIRFGESPRSLSSSCLRPVCHFPVTNITTKSQVYSYCSL